MSAAKFPPCPPQLKAVQHYIKLASDYEAREPVISYWARLYSLQTALKIDRKSPEAKALLVALMDWLEVFKKEHANNESITNDVAGQAVLENEAHKLFSKADAEDRAANFNKNVVKIFYTAGILFDVIEVFGELTEEIIAQRKYAKWKATYIHNCLKKGETPIPGPIGNEEDSSYDSQSQPGASGQGADYGFNLPAIPSASDSGAEVLSRDQPPADAPSQWPGVGGLPQIPVNQPQAPTIPERLAPSSGVNLTPELYAKAQKFCKYAISSLDYEDSPTAIDYITKALNILTTGKES
ncbi:UNVERIFIED_CONTAM: hypothetical protein GTU68_053971 [Idotea baltica]|nr:hypothetical protein [Idotea baltica]